MSQKGVRKGGRQKGAKNKATIAREEEAKAKIAAAMKSADRSADPKLAMNEIYKALAIAEGVAGKLQPRSISSDPQGLLAVEGGDMKGFGEWFDRWVKCVELLAKYQIPAIKPIEVPAAPPDPSDLDRNSRKRFGLRIFEGGRPLPTPDKAGSA